ncbi:MAG: thioredoxin, partial [Roseibium sp.]|nr:thioredoxin [Roseibium sp.]
EDGKRVLVVEGSIRNLQEEINPVPAVRLSIRNSDLQEIYAWTVEPRTKSLNGLDETRFRTILADPPGEASDIQVRFVERGKRQIVLE